MPYGHVLRSGTTVIQHIYDTHFAGVTEVAAMRRRWQRLVGLLDRAGRPRSPHPLTVALTAAPRTGPVAAGHGPPVPR
ncbi:hypothetical protein [Micromonospora echinaurantiaca]|uniref:hypothetical protein n=1 Tax=Micromonospora echinaurantiaca TaxID=47857 RepID=UPI0037B87B53